MLPLLACVESEAPVTAAADPVLGETVQVVPGDGIPSSVVVQPANNNLDVADHAGRRWLAFRTAPDHFASPDAVMYVLSTTDERTWTEEARFHLGADVREPRLLAWDDRLWLYFAELGEDPNEFEPVGAWVSERLADGTWTEPVRTYLDGFIPWRARVVGGVPYVIGYVGGENLYDLDGEPVQVHWLTTSDGVTLTPAVPGQAVVHEGGASETDFALLDDGRLVAVARNEAGEDGVFGSLVCTAPAGDLGDWDCATDPKRYDSPLVFVRDGRVWLFGRRNLTEDGAFDLGRDDLPPEDAAAYYAADYWLHPKRCALWEVDPATRTVRWVLDLPSQGDTCFAAVAPLSATELAVYNYSSPLDGEDLAWVEAQHGPTHIYRSVLTFP